MVRVLCYVVRGLGGAKEKTEQGCQGMDLKLPNKSH